MHKRIFRNNSGRVVSTTPDGVVKSLPVDNFSCESFNLNKFGHPKSDITLMLEYSNSVNFDVSKYNAFAQRLHMLKAEKPNNKTVEQLIHEWRPSWMQTISEEQRFAEWYYHEFDETVDLPLTEKDAENETVEPSTSES